MMPVPSGSPVRPRPPARVLPYAAALLLLLVALPLQGASGEERDRWIPGEGEAAVGEGGAGAATEAARQAALRRTVDTVLVDTLGRGAALQDAREALLDRSETFVLRYRVTASSCEGGTCRVAIEAQVAASALRDRLEALGLSGGGEPAWIRLELGGLAGWTQLQQVTRGLAELSGVESVRQREMAGDSALVEVRTGQSARQLAVVLATRPVGGVSLNVLEIEADTVRARIGRRPGGR